VRASKQNKIVKKFKSKQRKLIEIIH